MKTIGVDVGGTFTDLVYCDLATHKVAIHKVATTPDDPSEGVMLGVTELCAQVGVPLSGIEHVFHGTTTATNAVLENAGARAGLITNEGFRDVLHIGRHQRPQHYSIRQEIPWQDRPLIARRFRKTVGGRLVPPDGSELEPLDEADVRRAAQELKAAGVDSVAICFLFSYLNPAHELRAKEIVEEVMPEAFVTASSLISPQFREFERFTTAALAAFVGPKVRRYIGGLEGALRRAGVPGDLRIMASNGGVATPAMVRERPALTLQSGLAAGVLGGGWVGAQCGRDRLITFDIGGTSADIGIVVDGTYAETDARSTSIAGFPLLMPMLDIHTIGAGGGSIAHVDRGGAFRVGPQSAGAVPGPAAYGKGGTAPTVTDANLVLGRLEAQDFLGGAMALDAEAAETVIARLAETLGLPRLEAAEGVLTILNANMANAIRSRTVQKGIDPRGFALVAMGGAGPLHGAEVARMLSIPEVIVPPHPGITSAMGLLTTDLKYDAIKTQFQVSSKVDMARIAADLDAMRNDLSERFDADHVPPETRSFARMGDLRYVGQGYELRVPIPDGPIDTAAMDEVWEAFHAAHAREYGHAFRDNPIEIVNLRLVGTGTLDKIEHMGATASGSVEGALLRRKPCVFRTEGGLETLETAVYRRDALPAGARLTGPAIILQKDSTTVVPPGATAEVHPSGSLILSLGDIA
ncbi:hydantoinase/oxoprolinase family protein [Thetidibacter halocola]|uniref:Hydantoinase/oxoprolinase family protein n=1 Tax=Thetidibacter halocola TaxID=2827239 RepID=A0A8J7W875_9RHOB|nr:hydantoinase/oxoprolinase family protein [Thetidibacter halocola]MBS0122707.1 hydantoinase/oxoprolinase family protein [Thetidibacter halocola]